MNYLPLTDYEGASPEVKHEYDAQITKHGRITNMKRTLLHNVPAFHAYMEWYTLYDLIVSFTGERALTLFAHAISTGNGCLICSTFFRKILIDSGDDPDNPSFTDTEQLLVAFGQAAARDPHHISDELYAKLKVSFTTEQVVLLLAFTGIMAATNLFNTIAKVPLDEVLYQYTRQDTKKGV